ncbi:MAG: hypothetical protein ACSLEN_01165 [Candidatus Malihini olakiniferum]
MTVDETITSLISILPEFSTFLLIKKVTAPSTKMILNDFIGMDISVSDVEKVNYNISSYSRGIASISYSQSDFSSEKKR